MKTIIKLLATLSLYSSVAYCDDILLVDTSGSLSGKKEEVKTLVKQYLRTYIRVLAFNSSPYFIQNEDELHFEGGTALSLALQKVKSENVNYLTIITDGVPDNESKAIEIANELKQQGIKICGVFVSNDKKIPNTFQLIADKTFAINQVNKALEFCNDTLKNELLGKKAVYKSVDPNKYIF